MYSADENMEIDSQTLGARETDCAGAGPHRGRALGKTLRQAGYER